MEQNKSLQSTILDLTPEERTGAIEVLLRGKTPTSEVRYRPGRGGKDQQYVNVYYMTRMANLLFGWKWSSEVLEEFARPDWNNPKEIGVRIRVTVWDAQGNQYFHDAYGQKDVARYETVSYKRINGKFVTPDGELTTNPKGAVKVHEMNEIISIFDDRKAAISDGIKKCLSYFGIADDIYGGKEIELYLSDSPDAEQSSAIAPVLDISTPEGAKHHFIAFCSKYKLSYSKVFATLGVKGIDSILNYAEAEAQIAKAYSLPAESEVKLD